MIEYGDFIYTHYYDENGKEVLKTYDAESKMWIHLHFTQEDDSHIENELIRILSNEYIAKHT